MSYYGVGRVNKRVPIELSIELDQKNKRERERKNKFKSLNDNFSKYKIFTRENKKVKILVDSGILTLMALIIKCH